MKATTVSNRAYYTSRRQAPRFPNCAPRRITAQNVLDFLLSAAITVAAVVILLFLLMLA